MWIRVISSTPLVFAMLVAAGLATAQAPDLFLKSRDLTAADAAALEQQLVANPEDISARSVLVMYYFQQLRDESARAQRSGHVQWLIENAPGTEVLGTPFGQIAHRPESEAYTRAAAAWLHQLDLHRDDLAVIGNAAKFFLFGDRERSLELLERAAWLDPTNPEWRRELGHVLSLSSARRDGAPDQETAAEALTQLEHAWKLSDLRGRDHLLVELAETALRAGETEKAREYARAMLVEYPEEGNLDRHAHFANQILGRIAVGEDRIEDAGEHLLASGRVEGTPVLRSFGPRMGLALELLERGESAVVLEYLELCTAFWESGQEDLAAWTATIEQGEIPDFRAHLLR